MKQEVAELERQFSAIKTPGAMRSFLFGDPKANPSTLRGRIAKKGGLDRSEEHTSELQSLMRISYAVFCLKKKKKRQRSKTQNNHKPHEKKIHILIHIIKSNVKQYTQ